MPQAAQFWAVPRVSSQPLRGLLSQLPRPSAPDRVSELQSWIERHTSGDRAGAASITSIRSDSRLVRHAGVRAALGGGEGVGGRGVGTAGSRRLAAVVGVFLRAGRQCIDNKGAQRARCSRRIQSRSCSWSISEGSGCCRSGSRPSPCWGCRTRCRGSRCCPCRSPCRTYTNRLQRRRWQSQFRGAKGRERR